MMMKPTRLLPLLLAAALIAPPAALGAPARKPTPAKRPAAPAKNAKKTPSKTDSSSSSKSDANPALPKTPSDPAVTGHEKFPVFLEALNKVVSNNTTDYYDAVAEVLNATGDDETAVTKWMQEAARGGNAAAIRWLIGQMLTDIPLQKTQDQKYKDAYAALVRLGEKGFIPARMDAAACLRMGIGVQRDENGAVRQLMEASKSGDFLARYQWLLVTKRLASFEDRNRPEVASEIERGNHHVIFELSKLATDSATQVEWIKRAAEKGSGAAYFALSSLTSANNPKNSYVFLNEAVRLHFPDSLFVLASALVEENNANPFVREAGIQPDRARGIHLLKIGATLGSVQAGMALANAYYDGALGLPKDPAKAFFHFSNPQISATAMCSTARALLMLRGIGTPQDTAQGLEILQRAVQIGYPPALINLAYANFKGLGVKEDAHAAANLLKDAAAVGSPVAYVYLAYITAKGGAGLPADLPQAKRFIRLAEMDMGDRAQQLYDALMQQGDWDPHP